MVFTSGGNNYLLAAVKSQAPRVEEAFVQFFASDFVRNFVLNLLPFVWKLVLIHRHARHGSDE